MVRIYKQQERRNQSPRKHRKDIFAKTGPKKDALTAGFKEHGNAVEGNYASKAFIPKIK